MLYRTSDMQQTHKLHNEGEKEGDKTQQLKQAASAARCIVFTAEKNKSQDDTVLHEIEAAALDSARSPTPESHGALASDSAQRDLLPSSPPPKAAALCPLPMELSGADF